MKKKYDISLIVTFLILFIFITCFIFWILQRNNTENISSNYDTKINIYNHSHIIDNVTNVLNEQKTYEDISTYTTKIYDKDKNRIYNIKLACERLDGHIVAAGEEFSFNNTMGTMGKKDGYKKALGFDSNGNKIKMFGGGICQISSTLYNAVLATDLEVTERHAHSRRVYYVPKNKDATVFYGGPDFKFKNSSISNLMICTSTDGYTVTVTLKQENTINK